MVTKTKVRPDDCSASGQMIEMQPYKHQVGGHVGLFVIDAQHVCKPYNPDEANFYRSMPTELRPLTAANCFEVVLQPECYPPDLFVVSTNDDEACAFCRPRISTDESTTIGDHFCESMDTEYRDVASGLANGVNPWALECQMRSIQLGSHAGRFLVLENLTAKYRCPCIIDLKLGTRQYGDTASEEKRISQNKKSDKTTSKTMGLRLCGMQFYDASTNTYQCVDKYYGRSLDQRGLHKLMRHFFQDASGRTRKDICIDLLDRLSAMKSVLESLSCLRLYGASLLIAFEGLVEEADNDGYRPPIQPVEARLIDFANATCPGLPGGLGHAGVDRGSLLGLTSLMDMITTFMTA